MPSAVGYQPTLATEMGQLQERITSTKKGSVTSIQAIYVPADDYTDPAPATAFAHLIQQQTWNVSWYSWVSTQPLIRWLQALVPWHLRLLVRSTMQLLRKSNVLQRYHELQDIIAILGMDELSDEEKNLGCTCPSYPVLLVSKL